MSKITLTASALKSKMNKLDADNNALKRELNALDTNKNQVDAAWDGDASEAFKKNYAKERPSYDKFTRVVDQYITKCEEILNNYKTSEAKNVQIASN